MAAKGATSGERERKGGKVRESEGVTRFAVRTTPKLPVVRRPFLAKCQAELSRGPTVKSLIFTISSLDFLQQRTKQSLEALFVCVDAKSIISHDRKIKKRKFLILECEIMLCALCQNLLCSSGSGSFFHSLS